MDDDIFPGIIFCLIIALMMTLSASIVSAIHYNNLDEDCQKLNKTIIKGKVYECKEIK